MKFNISLRNKTDTSMRICRADIGSNTHTHTHTLSLSHTHTLAQRYTHKETHSVSLSHTHTHTEHTLTDTHS